MKQYDSDEDANSFASLFENSLTSMDSFRPGQMVETEIVSISGDCIFLQLSGKSEGVLDSAELVDKEGKLSVKEGDTIKVYFLNAKNGEMRFTTKISGDNAGKAVLENAYKNRIPVEGLVEKEIKGGYDIRIGDSRAFCPFSQMGLRRTEGSESPVGKRLTFKIQEFKEGGRSILVSNRAILEEARQEQLEALKLTLKEGALVKGTIKSIQDFGAFVDLDGIQALLPISEISRNRVEDIKSLFSVGQEIEASIIKIDWKNERLTLSLKSLLPDPWTGAADRYPKDSKRSGKVVRMTDFGAFVALEPGLDGLVHISEFRSEGKYASNAGDSVKVGQTLNVRIQEVDASRKRISLKLASSAEEDETTKKYINDNDSGDTYSPFAALLKKK